MNEWITSIGYGLAAFSFFYPLFMSYLWMSGALYYYFRYERRPFGKSGSIRRPPKLRKASLVSILVPCFNEEENIEETIGALMRTKYPNFDVIAINDGSTDRTGQLLDQLLQRYPRLRVVHQAKNKGKASALNIGAALTRAEFVVCIDGDAILDRYALQWMMKHFESPRVGAVTGNPRVRTRSTLLGRIQVGEFSSIIGLIKRAQRTYGRVFTVSGVISCFRKRALLDAGMWSKDMLTEDVDISWKIQARHWDVRFEPRALTWILMPETLKGLWRQRLRWATGGTQVLLKHARKLNTWRLRRMWPIYLEYFTSVAWAYAMALLIALWIYGTVLGLPTPFRVDTMLPQWTGIVIGTTCLLQVAVSMLLDGRYDKSLGRHYFWMIWYPLAYWLINVATTVVAFPRALIRRKGRAKWISPDRGLRAAT